MKAWNTAVQPNWPQEPRGCPGGRLWVQTKTCLLGFGIDNSWVHRWFKRFFSAFRIRPCWSLPARAFGLQAVTASAKRALDEEPG
jgi:hypothetical protein